MKLSKRLLRRGAVAVAGAAMLAGVTHAGVHWVGSSSRDAAQLTAWEPDPDMPLPEIDEPALGDSPFDSPVHPPGAHRHRHHSSQPGHA